MNPKPTEPVAEKPPYVSPDPTKFWRKSYYNMTNTNDLNQLIACGGKLVCPAVLGVVTPSIKKEHEGRFWFSAEDTRGIRDTIEEAKQEVERLVEDRFKSFY